MVQAALAERSRIMVAILKLVLVGTRHLGEVLDLAIGEKGSQSRSYLG